MATAKTVNFTPEQTRELVSAYTAAVAEGKGYDELKTEVVETFAEKFGKGAKSIVAKLTREGVYRKKEYVSKTGEKPVKKDSVADKIGEVLNLSDGETDSLAKANKTALAKILAALTAESAE